MTHPISPPAGDMEDVETSWGTLPRWKARALALSEIQSVVREARAKPPRRADDALGNQTPPSDTPETLAQDFRDAVAQVQRIRDTQAIMAKLDELEARMDAFACKERAKQALLDAEEVFTSADDDSETRH